MLNAIEVALIYLEDGAPKTAAARLQEVFDKFKEQEAVNVQSTR
jgi:DTW domain-containing protein YfiP